MNIMLLIWCTWFFFVRNIDKDVSRIIMCTLIALPFYFQYDPNGTLTAELPLAGKPWDVCLVNPFTVGVSLPSNKPWNMSYVSTIAIVDTIHMKTGNFKYRKTANSCTTVTLQRKILSVVF